MAINIPLLTQARQALASHQYAQAEPIYRQLLHDEPAAADLWHELGLLLWMSAGAEAAREPLERAVEIEPQNIVFLANLGALLRQLNQAEAALEIFQRALAAGPPNAELLSNLALAHKDLGQLTEALARFDQAVALRPDFAAAHFNRGNLLLDSAQLEDAAASYRRVLELQPDDAGAWCQLGIALFDGGDLEAAVECFDRASELNPAYAEPRRNRALVWLTQGDYQRGWSEFEHRLNCDDYVRYRTSLPRWQGEPLTGKSILLHSEQGLGDTLQFIRYVSEVEQLGVRVRLVVQSALRPLLEASGYQHYLLAEGENPACDYHCPLMSLPGLIAARGGQPFWPGAYLRAEASLVEHWKARLKRLAGVRIAIVWSGNPNRPHDQFRSASLGAFEPLARVPGVQLISLQQGAARQHQKDFADRVAVIDLADFDTEHGAFMDTAAILRNVDLLVTVDTSLAHLGGALGVPTWVLLQHVADWRWGLAPSNTPWYPSLRLFRQTRRGDWSQVLSDVATALQEQLRRRSG